MHAEYLSQESLDVNKLTADLRRVLDMAEASSLRNHVPSSGVYWKALDLVHLALRLNGMNVWDVRSPTGGSSVTISPELAKSYLFSYSRLTKEVIEKYLGIKHDTLSPLPSTKILVGLSDRLHGHTRWATHPNNEGKKELITDSMRISDMDETSQSLIREVFQLPPDFDVELIQGQEVKQVKPVKPDQTIHHIAGLARRVIGNDPVQSGHTNV